MGIKKIAVYGLLSAAAIAFAVYSPEIGRFGGRAYLSHKKAEKERTEERAFLEEKADIEAKIKAISEGKLRAEFKPEYKKDLSYVLMSYNPYGIGDESKWIDSRLEIIKNLPSYSKVLMLVEKDSKKVFLDRMKSLPEQRRKQITVKQYSMKSLDDSFPQNIGRGTYKLFFASEDKRHLTEDMRKLGINAVTSPLHVTGGNMTLARNNAGKNILFAGFDSYQISCDLFKEHGFDLSIIKDLYKKSFQADEVIIVDHIEKRVAFKLTTVFHNDQVFVPLDEGVMAVQKLPDTNLDAIKKYPLFLDEFKKAKNAGLDITLLMDYFALETRHFPEQGIFEIGVDIHPEIKKNFTQEQLDVVSKYKKNLRDFYHHHLSQRFEQTEELIRSNGFRVVNLQVDLAHIALAQSYVNLVPFIDRENVRRSILLPIFPQSYSGIQGIEHPVYPSLDKLDGLNKINKEILEKEGFFVIPICSEYEGGGNTFCLMNAL